MFDLFNIPLGQAGWEIEGNRWLFLHDDDDISISIPEA